MRKTWPILVLLAGCLGYQGPSGGGQAPDASTGNTPDAAGPPIDAPPPPDAGPACVDKQTTNDTGHHNAGEDCMLCHASGGGAGAPLFTVGGTLFANVNGGGPIAGATVRVTDANGQTVTMVSALNGNFYTSTPLAFPIHVDASSCPDIQMMMGAVAATTAQSAGCNKIGCHTTGFYVHLP